MVGGWEERCADDVSGSRWGLFLGSWDAGGETRGKREARGRHGVGVPDWPLLGARAARHV